jgi:hypothetical protein
MHACADLEYFREAESGENSYAGMSHFRAQLLATRMVLVARSVKSLGDAFQRRFPMAAVPEEPNKR